MRPLYDFKLALTRVIELTGGIELLTLGGSSAYVRARHRREAPVML
jgi:hypothetical protein